MPLTSCMNKAGKLVSAEDRKTIFARAAALRAAGVEPDDAGVQAIKELDAQLAKEEEAAVAALARAEGEASAPTAAPTKSVRLQNRNRSDAGYVQQMQSIAARPDYGRLGFSRDFASGAPVVLDVQGTPRHVYGRTDYVTTSRGRRLPVRYAVVEADSLLPSNTADGGVVEGYEDGAPERARVVAGNGRAAGVVASYDRGKAQAYREGIAEDASLTGIEADALASFRRPVLVREMRAEDVTPDIGDESNVSGIAERSAPEVARDDARRVDLAALEFDANGDISDATVAGFVDAMPVSEQTALRDAQGRPTRQARDRLVSAIFAAAYENDALLALQAQANDPEVRTVLGGLVAAAPQMVALRGMGDLDIRPLVAEAAVAAVNAKRRGVKLADMAAQADLDSDPAIVPVLEMFAANVRSAARIGDRLRAAATLALDEASKPAEDMFGAVPRRSRDQVFQESFNDTAGQEGLGQPEGAEPDARDAGRRAAESAAPRYGAGAQAVRTAEGRRAGQEGARQGLSSREPDSAYQSDLFGDPLELYGEQLPSATGGADAGRRQQATAAGPGNVDAAGTVQRPAGEYRTLTRLVTTRQQQLGHVGPVKRLADAANALAYLGRGAVERLDALVTDANGKPLAIVGGFKGATSQTPVFPATILSEVFQVPGAAKLWLVHNHPSGKPDLSRADEEVLANMRTVLHGTGIRAEAMIAIGDGRWNGINAAEIPDSGTLNVKDGPSVPAQEREFEARGKLFPQLSDPAQAAVMARELSRRHDGSPGIVMLNAQLEPVAFVPWSAADAKPLKHNGKLDALFRAVSFANASYAIIAEGSKNPMSLDAARNLAAGLAAIDVKALDIIPESGKTAAQEGMPLKASTLYSRSAPAPAPELRIASGYQQFRLGATTIDLIARGDHAEIGMVRTPEGERGNGSARKAMEQLLQAADAQGMTVTLTPEPMDRSTRRDKLEQFYRTLGFVPNRGRSRDFSFSGAMIRRPRGGLQFSESMSPELAASLARIVVPSTPEAVRAAVREIVGADGALPEGLGKIVVATSAEIKRDWQPLIGAVTLESEQAGDAMGFFDPRSKTIFLIADRIRMGQEASVALHELMHKHGRPVLGDSGWNKLHGAISGWASAAEGSAERRVYEAAAAAVRASRMPGTNEQSYSTEELFPYAVQAAVDMGIKPDMLKPAGTVARWLAEVRRALRDLWAKTVGGTRPSGLTARDMVTMAYGIAQRENPAHRGELDGAGAFQRVFHGTPYRGIQRFSTDRIGTGEGAQAYGWGLYFAGRKEIAEHYRKTLSEQAGTVDGKPIDARDPLHIAAGQLAEAKGDRKAAADELRLALRSLHMYPDGAGPIYTEAVRLLESGARIPKYEPGQGQLYEVDIPEDSEMLLWDRPISEQPERVRRALSTLAARGAARSPFARAVADGRSGEVIYRALQNEIADDTLTADQAQRAASEALLGAGIRGIKYLDGTSRGTGGKAVLSIDGQAITPSLKTPQHERDAHVRLMRMNGSVSEAIQEATDTSASAQEVAYLRSLQGRNVSVQRESESFNYVIFDGADTEIAGALYSFAGPLSRTADTRSLATAEQRLQRGEDAEEVRQDTGWFKGADGKWRYEINDADASLKLDDFAQEVSKPLAELLDHPALFAAYPALRFVSSTVNIDPAEKGRGRMAAGGGRITVTAPTRDEALSILLHEVQHGIQTMEGFARGGGRSEFARELPDGTRDTGFATYRRLAGEVEARNTQTRQALGDAARRAIPPSMTADVPDAEVIVRFNGKDAESAPPPQNGEPRQAPLPGVPGRPAAPPPPPQSRLPLAGGQPGPTGAWDMPQGGRLDDLLYKFQDKQVDLKRSMQAIRAERRAIQERFDAYLQEELYHGRAASRVEDFAENELRPLLQDMRMREVTQEQVHKFLLARHAREANELIASRGGMEDGGSGMTTADATAYLEGLDPAARKRLEAVAAKVDEMIAKTRQTYVDYGLESQDTVDGWAEMFKHYVPLQRESHDGEGMGVGQGFSIKGKESKSRTGSTAAVSDILANVAAQRERAIVRGEKNRVAVAMLGLATLNPNPDIWDIKPAPRQWFNEATGQIESGVPPNWRSQPNVLSAKVRMNDGSVVERAVVFNERNERAMRMAMALKNLDAQQLEGLIGVTSKITRYFASINTQYNPLFGLTNLVRDLGGAPLHLVSTEINWQQHKVFALTMKYLALATARRIIDRKGDPQNLTRGFRVGAFRMDNLPPTDFALWKEMQRDGGTTGYRELFRTTEDRANAIRRELDPYYWHKEGFGRVVTAGGLLSWPAKGAQALGGGLFNWLSDFNEALENVTRLAAYKVAVDQGLSKQRAASISKNLTVNFNRKGSKTPQLGALYAFFNAAMQGSARIAEVVVTMDRGDIKTLRLTTAGKAIVVGGITAGVLQALALAAAGIDEDDIPEFVRERNFIFPLPGSDKKYVQIPMPLGWHVLPNLGRKATEMTMRVARGEKADAAKTALGMVMTTIDAFNPLGGSGTVLQMVSPTVFDPGVALLENRDWTGRPIARQSFNEVQPGYLNARETSSDLGTWIAEALNRISGGSDFVAGKLSPTPDQIDYLIGQVTGGVGRELTKVATTARATATGEDLPPHKIPLVGRFYGEVQSQSNQSSRFYDALRRMREHKAEIEGLDEARRVDELRRYLKDNPEAKLAQDAERVSREVASLRKQRREMVDKGRPREDVKKIEAAITRRMEAFNAAVERAQKSSRQSATPAAPSKSSQAAMSPS